MIQILIAILAGFLTIGAPCILPLLPILLGTSIGQTSKTRPLFIIFGFITVFSIVGLFVSFIIRNIGLDPNSLRNVAIFVLGLFGLFMVWPKPFELLMLRFNNLFSSTSKFGWSMGTGNFGGFMLGMTLGLVWAPCAGPVLGATLALIASQKELLTAAILLVAYSIGASVPMLLIAYGGQYVTNKVSIIANYSRIMQLIFGIIIILLATALYFNYDAKIYSIILQHYPSFNPKY